MACPSCVKLKQKEPASLWAESPGIDYYCSQECFKQHWPVHKKKHKPWSLWLDAHDHRAMPDVFRGYSDWTGPLRPWARASTVEERQAAIPEAVPRPDYWKTGQPQSELAERRKNIRVYEPQAIAGIREACRVGRQVLDACGRAVKRGVTTAEIDRVCFEATIERGAYPSPLNYYNFPCSVCTSVNEVICHGIPDSRELEDGDIVNIDVSVFKDGYHGDLNETFLVGNVDDEGKHVVETAFKCLQAGASVVKPNAHYKEVGAAVDKVARALNCSVVRTYCGHGIGELFHTIPNVPHYNKSKAKGVMKPGHIFTIEPMINLGTWRDVTWPDQWTAVTVDGKRSAQFEHTFLVTEDGYEILTQRHHEPTMVWDMAKQQR